MAIKTRLIEGILIFDIGGSDLNFLKEDLRAGIEEATKKTVKIIINLKEVENISSHVIGSISSVKRTLSALQGDLVVINLSERISNIFKVVHLDKIIKITTSEQEAINYLKNIN